jgi:hypothetical protein
MATTTPTRPHATSRPAAADKRREALKALDNLMPPEVRRDLDAARVRRWATAWPEYATELLALAEQTETGQQTAAA